MGHKTRLLTQALARRTRSGNMVCPPTPPLLFVGNPVKKSYVLSTPCLPNAALVLWVHRCCQSTVEFAVCTHFTVPTNYVHVVVCLFSCRL